jgi:hypothetical protein
VLSLLEQSFELENISNQVQRLSNNSLAIGNHASRLSISTVHTLATSRQRRQLLLDAILSDFKILEIKFQQKLDPSALGPFNPVPLYCLAHTQKFEDLEENDMVEVRYREAADGFIKRNRTRDLDLPECRNRLSNFLSKIGRDEELIILIRSFTSSLSDCWYGPMAFLNAKTLQILSRS